MKEKLLPLIDSGYRLTFTLNDGLVLSGYLNHYNALDNTFTIATKRTSIGLAISLDKIDKVAYSNKLYGGVIWQK